MSLGRRILVSRTDLRVETLLMLVTGAKGVEYPERFFARDYANNRLEFSL